MASDVFLRLCKEKSWCKKKQCYCRRLLLHFLSLRCCHKGSRLCWCWKQLPRLPAFKCFKASALSSLSAICVKIVLTPFAIWQWGQQCLLGSRFTQSSQQISLLRNALVHECSCCHCRKTSKQVRALQESKQQIPGNYERWLWAMIRIQNSN